MHRIDLQTKWVATICGLGGVLSFLAAVYFHAEQSRVVMGFVGIGALLLVLAAHQLFLRRAPASATKTIEELREDILRMQTFLALLGGAGIAAQAFMELMAATAVWPLVRLLFGVIVFVLSLGTLLRMQRRRRR